VISGLTIAPGWVTAQEEDALLSHVGPSGARGTIAKRNIEAHWFGLELSAELASLCDRIAAEGKTDRPHDAVTVGWYRPGQSMRPHVDSPKAGEVIAVLGLGGSAEMRFTRDEIDELGRAVHGVSIKFERRMLVVMADEVRWMWKHEILPVTESRVSIVFRRSSP
jgi:alkylated DNA repair dioxygenase AlkB